MTIKKKPETSVWESWSKPLSFLKRGDLILVFGLALFIRMVVLAASNNQVGTIAIFEGCFDCTLYSNMARSIIEGNNGFEHGFFYFGPGYAYFLAICSFIFGDFLLLKIIVNILISSVSCLLIYSLAMKLTRSYAVSIIASLLAVTSYTSIAMSLHLLSDSFFFVIFLVAVLLFLKALSDGRWIYFILAGLVTGASVLTRSVGQFWPFMMICFAFAYYFLRRRKAGNNLIELKPFLYKTAVSVLIVLAITFSWMIRNYQVHGVATMAMTGGNGPANVAAVTIERLGGPASNETMQKWVTDYLEESGQASAALGETYQVYRSAARQTFDSLGFEVVKTYLIILWENLNSFSYCHRYLLPDYNLKFSYEAEKYIFDNRLNYLNIVLAMSGLIILLVRRKYWTAIVLGGIYFYFASMIGAFRWQYTRHFYPGQIAWAILIAVTLVTIYQGGSFLIRKAVDKSKAILNKPQ